MWELFSYPASWVALITLILLEILLGIDNILFLAILSGKLPENQQKKARRLGLLLAMAFRLALLFSISWILSLRKAWFYFESSSFSGHICGQNMILLLGGLFLIYKSIEEIRYKVTNLSGQGKTSFQRKSPVFRGVIAQIVLLDMIFSIDSLLTAIGLISLKNPPEGFGQRGLLLMALAIVVTIGVMLFFSETVSHFIHKYPSLQMLGLCFLMLIGLMLLSEASQAGKWNVNGYDVKSIPRSYLYFAIFFSLIVELLNAKRIQKSPEEPSEKKS
ncbi:TerC family protein [Bacteroidetes bacterium endosymbiont of Geopemphigus sp.]|uniref:TerC family protein n=1 Tax=Bacteroidetes bacterium endosymbiont of Geopemphigus sp. TaxID=2047937 RepID=UPI000CD0C0E8|nr:TerC family protein [Bacteroidetes bacterium endosymbiont of Geopemphigus sp.]